MEHSTASLIDACFANFAKRSRNVFPGPFGSPLEERFADALRPHLAPDVRVDQQRVCYTAIGRFVLDFTFTTPSGFCVAVECDGSAFHDTTVDTWRDAALISERKIDMMVRIDGRFLYSVPADVLYLLSTIAPSLVSARGRRNIVHLSTAAVQRYDRRTPGLVWVEYPTMSTLRDADAQRRRDADDTDAWEVDDTWYTDANYRAETGTKSGIFYITYEGRDVAGAGQDWRARARVIATNPGARLTDLLGLPLTTLTDAAPDPIGEAFLRAQENDEATIPAELALYFLPDKAPPEPPYEPSIEWRARLAWLGGADGTAAPADETGQ
ncbi:hypothetical protein [Gemmatimonas sp.]|uniref:hypothetical protein n=1 Tax=Gemmatimonas sp. TaxID=1962908 RepID=UPI00356561BE